MKFITTLLFCGICILSNAQNWFPVSDGIRSGSAKLFSFEDKLFIGGTFSSIDGIPASGIAYWNERKWHSFFLDGLPYTSFDSFGTYNDELYAYAFNSFLSDFGEIVKYNKVTNTWNSLDNSAISFLISDISGYASGEVVHAIEFQGEFYIAGIFDRIGDKDIKNIAKWDGTEWKPVMDGFGNEIEVRSISALEVYNDKLIISGAITDINNEPYYGIASWNGEVWSNLGGEVRANLTSDWSTSVFDLEVFQGELYLVSTAMKIPGDDQFHYFVKWDGNNWYGIEGFEYPLMAAATLKSFGNYLAIGGFFPNGFTYLYNGKTIKKIDQELTPRIINFAELNNQLFVSTKVTFNSTSDESGILKLGIIEHSPDQNPKFNLFPNPTDGEFMIGYELLENNSLTVVRFYNLSGILVYEETFNDLKGVYLRRFNLDDFPAGIYNAQIQSKEINESKKFVKN